MQTSNVSINDRPKYISVRLRLLRGANTLLTCLPQWRRKHLQLLSSTTKNAFPVSASSQFPHFRLQNGNKTLLPKALFPDLSYEMILNIWPSLQLALYHANACTTVQWKQEASWQHTSVSECPCLLTDNTKSAVPLHNWNTSGAADDACSLIHFRRWRLKLLHQKINIRRFDKTKTF